MLGTLMGSLDSTIVILAFPTISDSLHASFIATLWVILIYLLSSLYHPLGRLGDIYRRSRMFNAGFGIFTVGSLFCGLSPAINWLIASRIIQGVGGALMQANSGAIIADTFPPNVRGTAFGDISLGWTSGAMLGIVLGGIITTYVGWEYIFFINVPIGIVATILGFRYLTEIPGTCKTGSHGHGSFGAALTLLSFSEWTLQPREPRLPTSSRSVPPCPYCSLRTLRETDGTPHHRFFRIANRISGIP